VPDPPATDSGTSPTQDPRTVIGSSPPKFVSRGGLKLHHAIQHFHLEPKGWTVADFGCSTGGFTDCWLRHGAHHVFAVDTSYGQLDYTLRIHPRVTVLERTNAMHADPPQDPVADGANPLGINCVSIDLSWTTHDKSLPKAARWLTAANRSSDDTPTGLVVLLLKPHYEATGGPHRDRFEASVSDGALTTQDADAVVDATLKSIPSLGFTVLDHTPSPIAGAKSKRARSKRAANVEHLVLLRLGQDHADRETL